MCVCCCVCPCCCAQSGDEECLAAWGRICAASRKEFQAIYDRLGVTLNERGESFYNPMLKSETGEEGGMDEARHGCGVLCVGRGAKQLHTKLRAVLSSAYDLHCMHNSAHT
jgi:hypothetical protein